MGNGTKINRDSRRVGAVIVAAGRGTRAGGDVPKQWREIAGKSSVCHCLHVFAQAPEIQSIVLVTHPDDADRVQALELATDVTVVHGQNTRDGSVRAGLQALRDVDDVLIHDVARPCITVQTIRHVCEALQLGPAAAPGLPVTDALWRADGEIVNGTQDRTGLFRAQTPQGFHLSEILAAHATHQGGAADDVEVARAAGLNVAIVPGDEDNFKITHPDDFKRAARVLKDRDMDIRLGNGFDVHKFGPGDAVILCGVSVPFDQGLVGHSDADVGMHAVTDAIYGALAEGDIGTHFPPSDPQWKGAASDIFLRHAVQLAADKGYAISNCDCTLICELPKIGPHAAAMRAAMAEIMGMAQDRVSVKATTSEQLGFTGRGEGIAALATATLVAK